MHMRRVVLATNVDSDLEAALADDRRHEVTIEPNCGFFKVLLAIGDVPERGVMAAVFQPIGRPRP
jgi:hypothetical protein